MILPMEMKAQHSDEEFIASVSIRELRPGDDPTAFRTLNEEWIERFFSLESKDREQLGNPKASVIDKGGHIYFVRQNEEDVACVAIVPMGNGVYELSKMAVLPSLRGKGIGRMLLLHVIGQAKALGAVSLFLGSSTKLPNAVHLYETVGFRHVPIDQLPPLPYTRANVFMAMDL